MGVKQKNPTKVGIKNASKNNVCAFGILNCNTNLFKYLNVNTLITKNKTGSNRNIWCPIAPKKFLGDILNSEIEFVLSED
jgi:hypothetical protein